MNDFIEGLTVLLPLFTAFIAVFGFIGVMGILFGFVLKIIQKPLERDVAELKVGQKELERDIAELKAGQANLHNRLTNIESKMDVLLKKT